ncbi:MAG: hypothetical protein LUG62_01185 [Clostridiales bacterium]|nr:hypothetical protein [Clostridiales bacterium]
MKFKEFAAWCNNRTADGRWGYHEALICTKLCEDIYKLPFWRREKEWRKVEPKIMEKIIIPTNNHEIIRRVMFDEI